MTVEDGSFRGSSACDDEEEYDVIYSRRKWYNNEDDHNNNDSMITMLLDNDHTHKDNNNYHHEIGSQESNDDERSEEREESSSSSRSFRNVSRKKERKISCCSWNFLLLSIIIVLCTILMMFVAVAAIGIMFLGRHNADHGNNKNRNAKKDLRTFVYNEKMRNNLLDTNNNNSVLQLEDAITTDGFHRSANSFCWSASTYDNAKNYLQIQLKEYPNEIRSRLLERVVVEGISQSNSIQDTTTKLASNGKAHSYMAFWSSVYKPSSTVYKRRHGDDDKADEITTIATAEYDTCLLYASIEIDVAEEIIDYKIEKKSIIIGTKPCYCGFLSCERCPIYDIQTTKTPIFNRHTLSLQQQEELHRWLVKHAVETAESIVGTVSLPSSSSSLNFATSNVNAGAATLSTSHNNNDAFATTTMTTSVSSWNPPSLENSFSGTASTDSKTEL